MIISSQSDDTARRKALRRRWSRRLGILAATLLTATVVTLRSPQFQGNFGVVEPGRVYRSAQPGSDFINVVRAKSLKSVLDLRGGSMADPWYEREARVTAASGVDFYDFPMSATRRPNRRELLVLIDLFRKCRYPLLIHCKSGSDRTGLASAVYLMAVKGVPPADAERCLSLYYWHIPVGGAQRLHDPIVEYANWLVEQKVTHDPERFLRWVERDYQDADPSASFRPLRPGPRERVASNAVDAMWRVSPR